MMQDLPKIALLVVLVFGLWFTLVWTSVISCSLFPFGCEVYWGTLHFSEGGQPKVLIVHGPASDTGLGDPELLQAMMEDPSYIRVRPRTMLLDAVTIGNLRNYDLVIVTRAKKISSEKLEMFMEYVGFGGRLVWTGDAGTEKGNTDEYLQLGQREEGGSEEPIGPWARKKFDKQVSFDRFLGINYLGNYCGLSPNSCSDEFPWTGVYDPAERSHPLVNSIRPGLKAYGNTAIVKARGDTPTTVVLNLDTGGNILKKGEERLGRIFPAIVESGFGGRVVYYSIPPEMQLSEGMPERYSLFMENMYYGMLH